MTAADRGLSFAGRVKYRRQQLAAAVEAVESQAQHQLSPLFGPGAAAVVAASRGLRQGDGIF